jgi:peptidoglycan/xylan/chitin deacetylase (PgdA/CDA1 family)
MTDPCPELARFWRSPPGERLSVQAGERRAGRVVSLSLSDELRPPWLPSGQAIPLWLEHRVGEASGRTLATFAEDGRTHAAVVESSGRVVFCFDPDETIASILNEAYFTPRRPIHTYVPLPYQLVPGSLRLRLFQWLVKPTPDSPPGVLFPSWPIDGSVETLRFMYRRALAIAGAPALESAHWPNGKRSAFAISHDVDTAQGFRLIREVAAFENDLGIRSTWFIVGDLFGIDPSVLDDLRAQGHEIALHGDRHDNTIAYRTSGEIERRLDAAARTTARWDVRGFRSPSLLETPTLRRVLRERFVYASEVPDTEIDSLIAPRRGCGTCFPFRREGSLEIPLTLPLEDKLIMRGMNEAAILEHWRAKAAWVREVGGVVQLSIHNEPHLLSKCRGAYAALVRDAAADATVWRTTLVDLADWWTRPAHGNS